MYSDGAIRKTSIGMARRYVIVVCRKWKRAFAGIPFLRIGLSKNRIRRLSSAQRARWWAYSPIVRGARPTVTGSGR